MKKQLIKQVVLAGTVLLVSSGGAWAATANISSSVMRIMVTSPETFGGCMVRLVENPSVKLPTCSENWVTFSCDGTFNSKDIGYRKLDQAQMALALNKKVFIVIDDTKKHNGHCFVRRIDVVN